MKPGHYTQVPAAHRKMSVIGTDRQSSANTHSRFKHVYPLRGSIFPLTTTIRRTRFR